MTKTKIPPCEICKTKLECNSFKEGVRYGCENFSGDVRIFLLDSAQSRLANFAKKQIWYLLTMVFLVVATGYFFFNSNTHALVMCGIAIAGVQIDRLKEVIGETIFKI